MDLGLIWLGYGRHVKTIVIVINGVGPVDMEQCADGGWVVQAMGRALLLGLERGRYASAPFLLCRQLAGGSDFAVLTRRRLLCICAPSQTAPPTLRWAVALEDLFHIRRHGHCSVR
jgi:hypothetical protein